MAVTKRTHPVVATEANIKLDCEMFGVAYVYTPDGKDAVPYLLDPRKVQKQVQLGAVVPESRFAEFTAEELTLIKKALADDKSLVARRIVRDTDKEMVERGGPQDGGYVGDGGFY